MKVTPYVINKGTSSEYWGLKSVEDDPRDSQVLHTPKWKSKKSAIKYAEKNGMEVVESSSKASRKFVVSATNISCSDLTDEQANTLYELSMFAEDVIRDVEKDYGKKLSPDGWGEVMDYAKEITKHPETYRMTGTGIDSAKLHFEAVIYDIYEDDTGIEGIYESTDIKCSSRRKYTQAKATVPEQSADDFKKFLDSIGIDYTTEDVPNGVEFMYGIYVGSKESNRIDKYLDKITSSTIRGGKEMNKRKFVIQSSRDSSFKTFDVTTSATNEVMKGWDGKSFVDIARQCSTIEPHSAKGTIITVADRKGNTRSYEVIRKGAVKDVTGDTQEERQAVGASVSAKRRFTVTASAKTDLVKKLTSLYNDYNAIEDDRALRKTGMTLAEYNALPSVFEKLQKNGHANTIMTGLANYFKKFGFNVSLDGTDYEITASTSAKRRFTVTASYKHRAVKAASGGSFLVKTDSKEGEYFLTKSSTKMKTFWSADISNANVFAKKESALNKLYSVLQKLPENAFYDEDAILDFEDESDLKSAEFAKFFITDADGNVTEDVTDEVKKHLLADEKFISSALDDFDDEDEDIDASIKCATDPAVEDFKDTWTRKIFDKTPAGVSTITVYFKDGRSANYTTEVFDDMTTDSSVDYIIDAETGELLYESENGVVGAKSIECATDSDDMNFYEVDLMYERDGGFEDSGYFEDWSDAEDFAHNGLMRGFWVRIIYAKTGDTILISPDEYHEAWENGAADFDINDEIVEFKQKIVESSTAIECAFRDPTIDKEAVRELVLTITNDGDLYREKTTPILENLKKKAAKGKYDRELAVKLWQYLADEGVKRYGRDFGPGYTVSWLNPATRQEIAKELRDYYEEQVLWDVNHPEETDTDLVTL